LLLRTGLSVFHGFASKRYCHCCCCCDVSSRAGALRASAMGLQAGRANKG
jgi:hypothetical protein